MEEINLRSLWRELEVGSWIGGVTSEETGFLPIWTVWIRAAVLAGYRLIYFRQNGALDKAFHGLPDVTIVEAPKWKPELPVRLLGLLPREGPPVVGVWEDLGGLLSRPDPQEAQEILEFLDRARGETRVLWFSLIQWDPEIIPLFTPPKPLATLLLLPIIAGPEPLLLSLQLRGPALALRPGYYRVLSDPEPRLQAITSHAPWLQFGLLTLFRSLHHLRWQQYALEQRLELVRTLIEGANRSTDLNAFLQYLIRELVEQLGVDRGAIALRESPDQLRVTAEYRAIEGPSTLGQVIDLNTDPQSAHVLRTREPRAVSDPESLSAFGSSAPLLRQLGIQSVLIVPIVSKERGLGTISLDSVRAPRSFNPEEIRLVRTVAEGVAGVIERWQALEERERRARTLATLHRILRDATSASDLETFLRDALSRALEALGLSMGALWADGKTISIGMPMELLRQHFEQAEQPAHVLIQTEGIEDYERLPPSAARDAMLNAGIRATLSTPIWVRDQRIGGLCVGSSSPRKWRDEEATLVEAIAAEIGHAIERFRSFRNLRLLYRLADALVTPQDLSIVLRQVFEEFRTALGASTICLYLIERQDPPALIRIAHVGKPERFSERIQHGEITFLEQALQGKPVWTNLSDPDRWLFPPRTVAAFPLQGDGATLGIFLVAWPQLVPFNESLHGLLVRAAKLLTAGVLNRRLWEELRAHARELETLNQTLQHALLVREQMIQNVSHELRTPLAILQGYLELMGEEALGPLTPAQRDAIGVMRSRLEGLIRYVDLLLTLQEIQAGLRSLNILDLRELIRSACRAYQVRLDPLRHSLVMDVPDQPVWVLGEGQPLLLAFSELLENAVKFSPHGGTIRVSLRLHDHEACLQVADEGIGIPPEALPRVFDPFYQVNGGTTREFSGMGIGLAAVKRVVEAHRGRIEIESEVGRGTRVTLYFPTVVPPGSPGEDRSLP